MISPVATIPTLTDIDERWLTEVLRRAGFEGLEVSGMKSEAIGTGQVGKCVRIHLDYSGSDGGAPSTLVAKFPSDDVGSRRTAAAMGLYQKEIVFYRDLKPHLNIQTARSYFAEISESGEDFALLLDDLAPAEQGDQILGCTVDLTEKAVTQLLGLHAPTWQRDDLLSHPMVTCDHARLAMEHEVYQASIDAFTVMFSDKLSPDQINIFQAVAQSPKAIHGIHGAARSLIHMDYRLDNLMIRSDGKSPELSVVDWQTLMVGNPLRDVAYFISTSHTAEERRSIEKPIVEAYHRGLMERGVVGYSWEDCWLDYRWGALAGFMITETASVAVERTERGDRMFTLIADRQSQQALDLGAEDLLAH